MEILMKLKCSPAPNGNVPHPATLKVMDHHHQLQQHTLLRAPPTTHTTSVAPLSVSAAGTPQESLLSRPPSACLDCVTPTMDCCGAAAQRDMLFDLQWRGQRPAAAAAGTISGSNHSQRHAGSTSGAAAYRGVCDGSFCRVSYESPTPACCASLNCTVATPPLPPLSAPLNMSTEAADMSAGARYEYQEPEENFVSIEDSKIKGLLLKIGREREERESALRKEKAKRDRDRERAVTNIKVAVKQMPPQIVYEIIDLDDEEEREKLQRIKNQIVQKRQTEQQEQTPTPMPTQTLQVITSKYPRKIKSPNISLIPRIPEVEVLPSGTTITVATVTKKPEEKIIARIDLLDTSSESEAEEMSEKNATDDDEDNDDDDDELPLAAAAVSCELDCEDDDEDADEDFVADDASDNNKKDNKYADVVLLASDDENADFIDEHEEGLELRWDELEEQKERNYFECFLCGKKVQSSYNLRRHMMIHTGERPFGCDLCDRRFREFSDLKKHRRRHVNEPNFVCMVCRVEVPTEQDPTRCSSCDNKAGAIIAATLSQATVSPSASSTSSSSSSATLTTSAQNPAAVTITCVKKPPSRNITPAPSRPSRPSTTSPAPVKTVTPTSAIIVVTSNNIQTSPPPLTPIASINTNHTSNNNNTTNTTNNSGTTVVDTQLLLDNIPPVHRPNYNQPGVVTRKEFPCPLCQRPFGTRHNLKRHFMIHTGEKPFSCTKCRKPFREYSTLKKHMITHQRDRWYKCLRCPQKFRDYLDYVAHRETHPKYEETPLADGVNRAKRLKNGKYSGDDSYDDDSSSEDWLECCECGQRFTELETYTAHIKQHDHSFCLYECYLCKKDFDTHALLIQHMNKAHWRIDKQDQNTSVDAKGGTSTK